MERLIEKTTPPKYFNCKVVCVANGLVPYDLTVGKIYEFVDGNCKNNRGGDILVTPAKDITDLNSRFLTGVRFIPLVE
jgi:hypothetical protein